MNAELAEYAELRLLVDGRPARQAGVRRIATPPTIIVAVFLSGLSALCVERRQLNRSGIRCWM